MGKFTQISLFLLVSFVAYMTKGFLDFGILRQIEPHSIYKECHDIVPNQGKHIPTINWRGCEDTEIDRESGLIFIACSDHQGDANVHTKRWQSSILMYNTSSDTVEKLDIEFFAPAYKDEFFVHGISVVRETDGLFLYSVNHSPDASGDSVYVFKFNPKRRQLFQTGKFRHELMSSMNDVVAIGKGQFYATNDMWQSHGSALGLAESFLRLPVTSAISCNLFNQTCTRAAKWIRSGNGIAYHKSANRVLISGCLDLQIHVYKRLEDNSLEYEYSIPLGSAPDNIHVDEREVVWTAVHPKILSFLSAFGDDSSKTLAPSQILAISLAGTERFNKEGRPIHSGAVVISHDPERYLVEQTLMDNGETIISASTALPLSETKTILASVFQPKYVVCTMKDE